MGKSSASEQTLILALVNGVAERARIRTATSASYELSFVARVRDLEHALRTARAPIAAVIVEDVDVDRRSTCDVVRLIRRTSPGTPVVGYCAAGMRHSNDIRALVIAGVHELLFRNIDDAGIALRAVIQSAQRASVGEVVTAALKERVPSRLWQFVQRVVTHPAECQRVSEVATALGYHRKTLVNHCAQALLPPPRELLAWCRLAVVGHLLGTTARSVESIALELDFPSDTALRNLVKRHVGLRATEVRRRGGLACILQAFEAELRRYRGASSSRKRV